MLPEHDAVQVPPPAPVQVQVQISEAGKVSATVAPVALLGPALLAFPARRSADLGVAVVTPSVLVMARSALAASVSLSVAELLPGVGGRAHAGAVATAAFLMLPFAGAEMLQLAV